MEPVGTALLVIAGIGLGGKALYAAQKKLRFSLYPELDLLTENEQIEKNLEDQLKANNPVGAARRDKIQKMMQPVREMKTYIFHEMIRGRDGKYTKVDHSRGFSFVRANMFDEEKDALIHGVLKTVDDQGRVVAEDIYVYQPRVYGKGEVLIGPRYEELKKTLSPVPYACTVEGRTYAGYIPKREVASNMIMDFDISSPFSFEERFPDQRSKDREKRDENELIQKFIQVSFDKDENGNYRTVNLLDPEEKAKFDAYIAKHERINSVNYYMNKIRAAQNKLYAFLRDHKPAYVPPVKFGAEDIMTVEDKRQADQDKLIEKMNKLADIQYREARYGVRPIGSEPSGRPPMGPPNPSGPMNPYNPVGQMNPGNIIGGGRRR